MADMITIDASAMSSIDYKQYLYDYFATTAVGSTAGASTYYGGNYQTNYGYYNGSQVGFRYAGTDNNAQVVIEGADLAYDGLLGPSYGHGISGSISSISLGAYDEGTTYTQDDTAGVRGELTGILQGLVISGLDYSAAIGAGTGEDNLVYQIYNALRKANSVLDFDGDGDSGYEYIDYLYDLLDNQAQHFVGSAGADTYTGTDFADQIEGNVGNDILNGGAGADVIAGGLGADTMDGGKGVDTLDGGAGDDTLAGGTENDTVNGGNGKDILSGDAGRDVLAGGNGADILTGGAGIDTLSGNAGADTFVFALGDSSANRAKADTITDFNGKQGDIIDLSGIDANDAKNGDQAFSFIGDDAFSKHAGELRAYVINGERYVAGDNNGDGKADFTIHIDSNVNFRAELFDL
jgi:Ca2+-binding RTX toxin-like protein